MTRSTVWKRGIAISLPLIVSCVSSLVWLAFAQSAAATVISSSYKADWIALPANEDAPLCAYAGHRVKIVYDGSGVASPATVSDLRSIVNRMNWKIKSMALLSSGTTRPLEMKVDCDASGRPRIYSLGKESVYAEFGEPDGAQAVKYLVFSTSKGAQGGYTTISGKQEPARAYVKSFSDEPEPTLGSEETVDSNYHRTNSSISIVYREANDGTVDFWHSHVPIHELFHGFGAVLQGPPGESPPGLEGQGHCSDNIDLMCGVYLTTENPCQPGAGSPPYDSPAGVPLDCQFNTYFDSVPEAGEWLSKYWNTGGPEDPFLADPNTYVPEKKSGLEFDLASSANGQLDVVVRSPDSSLRYTARVNGVWNKSWTFLGGSLTSAPVLVSPQPGRLDVFACSYDGTVAHRTLASGVWGEWEALGAGGSPAHCDGLDAVSWGPGRLDVFVRDGGNVYQRSYSASAWGGWSTIASPGNFAVSSVPSVVSRKEGDLLLFVRNGTTDLKLRRFSKGAWGAWESLDSPASLPLGPPEAIPNSYGDNAHPFVLGYGGNIFSRRVFDGGAVIWQNQGGGPGTSNAAAIAHSGIVDVYSVSGAGRMQVRRNAYELSTTWQDLGGWFRLAVMPRVVALAGASERSAALAAIGEDGKLYVGTDTDSGWKGWQQVAWPGDVNPNEAFDVSEARPWGLRSIPNPPGPNPRPLAVSCNSPDACTAVGTMASESAWAWHWDGAKWTSEGGLPYPIGAQASKLNGVACTATMSCTAVGQYKNSSGVWRAFAMRWDGSTWSAQTTPSVASGDVTLSSVSCTAVNACTAVGSYVSGSKQEPLALRWTGASEWTQQALPSVKGSGLLKGVSCASATACQAVGFSGESEAAWQPLAAAWNGSSWSIQTSPSPENMPSSALTSVSCTAANACTAVGYDINPSAREGSLAMRWNGSAWTIQASPQADGTWGYRLNSVTCLSASLCTAAGADGVAPNYSTLALRWNGTNWAEQPTPDPGGATTYGLYGVSCTLSTSCMAVGWQQNGSEYASITEELQGGTPRVTPLSVTGVAKNQATLRSWVNPNGSATTYRFEWGNTTSYGNVAPAAPASAGSGLVDFQAEQQIQGIVGEHTYHYRLVAENSEGTTYGPDQQFTTPIWKPTVAAKAATGIGSGKATLQATVNPNGFATTYQFEWGDTTSYGNVAPATPASAGSGLVDFPAEQQIQGIVGEHTYHYRIVATNAEGTSYSADESFSTPSWRPEVSTTSAIEVLSEWTTLNGTVNPKGFAATYQFEYGTTKSLGTKVPLTPESAGSGTSPKAVGITVIGLKPLTTYYYRVTSTNIEGNAVGTILSLKTYANNFWTESAPATLLGESTGALTVNTSVIKLTCNNFLYSGSREGSKGQTLTLSPTFSNCFSEVTTTGAGSSTTVSMGGCGFQLSVYGTLSITGANCATSPMTYSWQFLTAKCTVTIGPQTIHEVTYGATGAGKERAVTASIQSSALQYTLTGYCPKTGTYSDGIYSGPGVIRAKAGASPQGIWLE